MKSGIQPGSSAVSCLKNISGPKFHLFQSVNTHAEGCPYPDDYGRVIGVFFDPEAQLQCHWWYEVDYPNGCTSSPWVEPGYKEQIPESDITPRD